jgi:hypothetical protein
VKARTPIIRVDHGRGLLPSRPPLVSSLGGGRTLSATTAPLRVSVLRRKRKKEECPTGMGRTSIGQSLACCAPGSSCLLMHACTMLCYWHNSFIERMLNEADNEQRSKQTRSNPSPAPSGASKDGRRGKGADYSSATGGSSASIDNEDFERCLLHYKSGLPSYSVFSSHIHTSHVVMHA